MSGEEPVPNTLKIPPPASLIDLSLRIILILISFVFFTYLYLVNMFIFMRTKQTFKDKNRVKRLTSEGWQTNFFPYIFLPQGLARF